MERQKFDGRFTGSRSPWNMTRLWRSGPVAPALAMAVAVMLLTGCSGGGSSEDEAPIAAALVVGQSQEQVTVTVRSGSEVVLNGENSDGTRFPIESATWEQTDSSGLPVTLVKRTDLTRAFRVPMVTAPTTLTFDLTIENLDGDTSTQDVTVNVVPVDDSNRFLDFFRSVPGEYTVVAALRPGTTASSDVTFAVTERRLVDYPDRTTGVDGARNRMGLEVGSPQTKTSAWPAGTQAVWSTTEEGVNAFYHPNLVFPVPRVNIDEINIQFDDTDPDEGIADHRRDDVKQYVELSLEVTGGTCEDDGGAALDCQDAAILYVLQTTGGVADAVSGSDAVKRVEVDVLTASTDFDPLRPLQPESAATAAAYYEAVDPFDRRTTFADWLQNAGFTNASGDAVNDGSTAHALYINNYDLGFTRDMFVRTNDAGDVFAYVTNYPALRKATLGEDVIATVAMEYGPPDQDSSLPRIVKFFVFSPSSQGQGEQIRVSSLNFDGRGEKPVPGACVACHGGTLRKLDAMGNYPEFGDIDAAFLPWDLESFLYVDADDPDLVDPLVTAGFEVNPQYITPEDLAEFSLENQQGDFRRMNEIVLTTMKEKPGESPRFELVRQQIHDWYGSDDYDSDDLPDVDYDGRGHIPPGWVAAGQEEVYHEVFARHCRICHSQLEGNTLADIDVLRDDPDTRALVERFVYEDGLMPNARLDMDRFWVDYRGGSVAPATQLAEALGFDMTDPKFTEGPRRPIARLKGEVIEDGQPRMLTVGEIDSDTSISVSNGEAIRLDGSISALADAFAWRLVQSPAADTGIVGADTAKPAFRLAGAGDYVIKLHVGNAAFPLPDEAELSAAGPCGGDNCAVLTVTAGRAGPQPSPNATFERTIAESIVGDETVATIPRASLEYLNIDDSDPDPADIVYTFTSGPSTAKGSLNMLTFSQQDVNDGLVNYTHDVRAEGPTDILPFTVNMGSEQTTGELTIRITQRNDEPFNEVPGGRLTVVQGAPAEPFGPADAMGDSTVLHWRDFEFPNDPLGITYTLTSLPAHGTLNVGGGAALAVGDTFTQADVNDQSNGLTYAHDDSEPDAYGNLDTFGYVVADREGLSVGPVTYEIDVENFFDAPQLRSTPFAIERGLERLLPVELAAAPPFPGALLAVLDPDSGAGGVTLTLETAPGNGRLIIRGVTDDELTAGESFSIDEVYGPSRPGAPQLIYQNTDSPGDESGPVEDTFTFSLVDDGGLAGICNPTCQTVITISKRSDGPTGPDDGATVMTSGILDPDAVPQVSGTPGNPPPWNSRLIELAEFDYSDADGPAETPGSRHDVTFRLVSQTQPSSTGFLEVNGGQLGVNGTFTRQDLSDGDVSFENRALSEADISFVLDITDGDDGVTIRRTLTVDRTFNFQEDVGWVLRTPWPGGTCSTCHDNGTGQPQFVTADRTTLICATMENSIKPEGFPDEPTRAGHGGGSIFTIGSSPHDMLVYWAGRADPCP